MARDESNREDIFAESTALVERVELLPHPRSSASSNGQDTVVPVLVGFRADGAMSVFFGEDPVFQFNAAGELRRAYGNGLLYKAVRGQLVSLQRVRTTDEVQLLRHTLSDAEHEDFLFAMKNRLRELSALLVVGEFGLTAQVPHNADVLSRVRKWLASHESWPIAARPNA